MKRNNIKTDIQAAILAGGRGTRLLPITDKIPKPMVFIHGKPFLLHQIEYIKSFGINRILLLVGYLDKQIKDYFGDGLAFDLKIEYSCEKKPMGTGGALKNAEDKLEKEFMVFNGDTFLPIDYSELVGYFRSSNKTGAIAAYCNTDYMASNNIALGELNMVIAYDKKDSKGMTHVDAGVMVFKKDVLDFIPAGQVFSLEEEVFLKLIEDKELVAFPTSRRFCDMGSFEGLEAMERILR